MNKILLSIPFIGKQLYKKELKIVAEDERKNALCGNKYETFGQFLQNCSEYSIDSSAKVKMMRNILRSFGVKFQQYVFIDKSSTEDKTAFIRKEGNTLLHEKGTYLLPWDSQKDIIYFDIQDMRPLIDKTKDINWYNPDTCADVVTSITNSKTLEGMNGQDSLTKYMILLIVISGLAVLISLVSIYQGIETEKAVKLAATTLNNSISNWGT